MTEPASVRPISSAPSIAAQHPGPAPAPHDHIVQFYESEEFLASAVAEFLAAGLAAGEAAVIIAEPKHRDAFVARLRAAGVDVDAARRRGRLTLVDAREALDKIMDGPVPDAKRFRTVLGDALSAAGSGRPGQRLRAYGEMVDILWREGNTDGAVRLEELWNELAATHAFSLLCAYAMGNFYKEAHGRSFHEVCRQHSHVVPTEAYVQANEAVRLLEISILQQRARALETEIECRKDLERRLREALAARHNAEEALRGALARERAARAEAEAANRAKSEFLTAMSHELRTPLNAIAGHAELVEMGVHGPLNEAQRDALQRVQRSQRHLLALVTDVLNLARIQASQVAYLTDVVGLAKLVADVVAAVTPLAAAKQLRLAIEPPVDAALAVSADADKVRQIVLNLLSNAIKFTPPGGRIAVTASVDRDLPETACVQVRDTGIGIPAAKLQAVFEPFAHIGGVGGPREGVGLALSISRDLARGMRGDLCAHSVVGEGSTFTLRLPLAG